VVATSCVFGCTKTPEVEYTERPVQELYNQAIDHVTEKDYESATDLFLEVERQHPYSIWAIKAQLMGSYAYYVRGQYDDAILGLERFIQLHPGNRDIAYAYYLKGLSYYEQITDVGRDQRITELALTSFKDLIQRFPNSKYARDAELKIDLTQDHLAGKEMEVGRFYLNRGQYLAAINRFQEVTDKYQYTTHTPEALHRIAEAYTALGIDSEAKKYAALLGHNFPGSQWYTDSYGLIKGIDTNKDSGNYLTKILPNKGSFFNRFWPFTR
tara:strand:- start:6865 stop:7671 length:807 start_codon:yes stop_codon:yes gene_type:complete